MNFMSFYNKIVAQNEKFIRGAQLCDIGIIKEAINSGADVNYRNAKAINSALQYYDAMRNLRTYQWSIKCL